jgi:hypothetical protein
MKLHLLWIAIFLFLSPAAFAGSIVKVSGSKVFIVFNSDDSFAEGDLFVAVNSAGKKTGLILIKKVRGVKAIGLLKKGRAVAGSTMEFKGLSKKGAKKSKVARDDDSSDSDSSDTGSSKRPRYGVLVGYGIASQSVKNPADGKSYDLTGSSNSIKGLYDHSLFDTLALRVLGGGEIFSVAGTGPAANPNFTTDIKYLTLDLLMKWDYYSSSSLRGYFVGGMGAYYPMSKTSTAIDANTLTSFVIGEIGGGLEIKFKKFSVPLEASYYYFPAGETVKTTVISIKTGLIF